MNAKKYIYERVQKAKELKRTLILGSAVDIFFEMYHDEYILIKNKNDIDNLLYKCFPSDKVLVIGDFSTLDNNCQRLLSRFMDDTPCSLIIFAREDNLSLHSIGYFNNIIKIPNFEDFGHKKYSVKEFIDYKYACENSCFNNELESLKYCPEYLYLINDPKINKNLTEETIDLCLKITNI